MAGEAGGPGWRGLEVAEDMGFQRRDWRFERVAWAAMAALVLAGLLGAFSRGPLSRAEARDPGGLVEVRYERFLRHGATSPVDILVAPAALAGGGVELRLAGPLFAGARLEGITPTPQESHLAEGGWVFRFPARDRDRPGLVKLQLRPEALAFLGGTVAVEGHPPARLRAFAYP